MLRDSCKPYVYLYGVREMPMHVHARDASVRGTRDTSYRHITAMRVTDIQPHGHVCATHDTHRAVITIAETRGRRGPRGAGCFSATASRERASTLYDMVSVLGPPRAHGAVHRRARASTPAPCTMADAMNHERTTVRKNQAFRAKSCAPGPATLRRETRAAFPPVEPPRIEA